MLSLLFLLIFSFDIIQGAENIDSERINKLFFEAGHYCSSSLKNYFLKQCSSTKPKKLNSRDLAALLKSPNLNWDQTCNVLLNLLDMNYRTFSIIVGVLAENHPTTLLPIPPKLDVKFRELELDHIKNAKLYEQSGYRLNWPMHAKVLNLFCAIFNLNNYRPQFGGKRASFDIFHPDDEKFLIKILHELFTNMANLFQTRIPQLEQLGNVMFVQSLLLYPDSSHTVKDESLMKILEQINSKKLFVMIKCERNHYVSIILTEDLIFVGDCSPEIEINSGIVKFTFKSIDLPLLKSLIEAEDSNMILSQNENLERAECFHLAPMQQSGKCLLNAWLLALFTSCHLLNVDENFFKGFKKSLKINIWKSLSSIYINPELDPESKELIRSTLIKAYFKFNIESNQHYILPKDFGALSDNDILENFQDLYAIGLHRNLDYSQIFNLWEYSIAVARYQRKSSKRTNGEVYLEGCLKRREFGVSYDDHESFFTTIRMQFGGSGFQEQHLRDPFLTALALVYFENGQGIFEFFSSLNQKQLDYVKKYAISEPHTLLDIFCLRVCQQTDISVRAKDLSLLITLLFSNNYLSIFEFASPNPLYAELLFVEIEDATILTHFFQLLCFERSKNYTEKNFYQMYKLTEELMGTKDYNEVERAIKAQVADIFSRKEGGNLNFRFSWIRSIYLKFRNGAW
jgi:hypothetical protein